MRVKTKFNSHIDTQTKSEGYVWLEKDGKYINVRSIAKTHSTKQYELMNSILDEAKRFIVPIRPDRTVHRNPNHITSDFHHNQMVNC